MDTELPVWTWRVWFQAMVKRVKLRYSEDTINFTDILFFWGNDDFELAKSIYPTIQDKSLQSGSPIIDHINLVGQTFSEKNKNKNKTIFVATSCG